MPFCLLIPMRKCFNWKFASCTHNCRIIWLFQISSKLELETKFLGFDFFFLFLLLIFFSFPFNSLMRIYNIQHLFDCFHSVWEMRMNWLVFSVLIWWGKIVLQMVLWWIEGKFSTCFRLAIHAHILWDNEVLLLMPS